MTEAFDQILKTTQRFYGSSIYLPLMLLAVFYLLIRIKSASKVLLVSYTLLILATYFMPFIYLIMKPFFRDGMVYWRFLWLLPYAVLIAVAATDLVSLLPKRVMQIGAAVVLVAIMAGGGKTLYTSENWQKSSSFEKVSLQTLQALDLINKNREATGNEYAMLAAPSYVMSRIHQVDPSIRLYVGRNLDLEKVYEKHPRLYRRLMILDGNMTAEGGDFGGHFRHNHINYVMVPDSANADQNLSANGYEVAARVDDWKLWYNPDI